ncbi:quinone oxidoreductase-like protein 1 [Artemia franciscana]|uniref:Enoyl reductase (ER) domain-containing protein n=1 Tax=Artemia franciscana TaxID=6661 RepID=A0AA88HKM8_ARTSF|nr:hypothetical protein QYM36_012035 [Artemia franciscana]KAK2710719.1 hypothetical protein QYM36_012035 [Artemia franciscana]KAK2710720.1 hypothetical protein QYM36_012035 [Artemia franciscana]KAK2710721.1 hypothetical protein QYM36_012035 [Artemia franciscana]
MAPASIGRMKACYIEEGRVPLPPDCHESQAAPGRPPHFRPPMYYVQRDAYIETEVEIPKAGQDYVSVQVKACGLSKPPYPAVREVFSVGDIPLLHRLPIGYEISGYVHAVGSQVTTLRPGDAVVGLLPSDYNQSGCSEYVVMNEFDLVKKPPSVSFVEAAGTIGDAVKAYTALHYLGRMCSGDTILILDGASPSGSLALQLASLGGVRAITTASSQEELSHLQGMQPQPWKIIDISEKSSALRQTCLEETSGLGVDLIVDFGPSHAINPKAPDSIDRKIPSRNDIISCLAVGGRWVTSQIDLTLDATCSRLLYLKCASIGFLNEQSWVLCPTQASRYQHILMDIMDKLADRNLRPNIHHTVSLDAVPEALKGLNSLKVGKVVVNI